MKPKPLPNPKPKEMTRFNSIPLPLCFRPSTTTPPLDYHHTPPSATTISTPTLTTCLYQTNLGIFALTWSHTLFSRSLHLTLHPPPPLSISKPPSPPPLSLSSLSFHLTLKPFLFWNKRGIKKISSSHSLPLYIYWDLTHAKFGSGSSPEPTSGFYIAVVYEGEIIVLVGDLEREAISRIKAKKNVKKIQSLVIRREHIVGNRFYSTRADFGGKSRVVLIELNEGPDPRLIIRVDSKRVIQVKHLKWKFRGSERVEVDGSHIQLSWDVYNWLFDEDEDYCTSHGGSHGDGCALFTFRFEKDNQGQNWKKNNNNNVYDEGQNGNNDDDDRGKMGRGERGVKWSQDLCGLNYEKKKMKKKILVKTISGGGSSSSISSMSSGSSSSVLDWESVEENELKGPTGFSLLLYAWKR